MTTWFLAIHLISQAKIGLSSMAPKRDLGVSYPMVWLIHHKVMEAVVEREARYVLDGQVQINDAYLGGERSGGKAGRGSENKVPFVAAVSLNEAGRPRYVRLTPPPSRPSAVTRSPSEARRRCGLAARSTPTVWPASVPSPA